jgi:hypothetical protein
VPQISAFHGIVVRMWWNEHPPPHFHVTYGDCTASVSIETLHVVAGWIPSHARRMVIEWALRHRPELAASWRRARAKQSLEKIAPLS